MILLIHLFICIINSFFDIDDLSGICIIKFSSCFLPKHFLVKKFIITSGEFSDKNLSIRNDIQH